MKKMFVTASILISSFLVQAQDLETQLFKIIVSQLGVNAVGAIVGIYKNGKTVFYFLWWKQNYL